MKSFNVLDKNLNIHESYLLEASAGTGKTFSIENIVTRLLIEGDNPCGLDQILVVTFTKAATKDLKNRIRQNIETTLKILESGQTETTPEYLEGIFEKDEDFQYRVKDRLKTALFTFDQAQIFTIHSFCFKMLDQQFLESDICLNVMNDEATLTNTEVIKIIRNFFRTGLKPNLFSKNQLNILLKRHKSKIENLEKALLKWTTAGFNIANTASFDELHARFKENIKNLKFEKDKIIADFDLQSSNYKKFNHVRGIEALSFFASLFEKEEVTKEDFDTLIEDGIYFLDALDEALIKVKIKTLSDNELFYPDFKSLLKEKIQPIIVEAGSYEMIFSRMASLASEMIQTYISEEEKFRFDDLLKLMRKALKNKLFLKGIQGKYKAGIIDEFQDTDPLQWDIFREIFYGHCPIYLVGDPKQSIYAFRQADIYTYLNACFLIPPENRLSLDTNYRSHPPLVNALNALFEKADQFIELPKLKTALEYQPVKFSSRNKEILFDDAFGSLHFFVADDEEKKLKPEEFESKFYFPFIAEQIHHLKKSNFNPSQMAILVKDHFQAKRVSDYLKEQKIDVSLQRQKSLSESTIYLSVMELISAVLHPKDESNLKIALGGLFFGFSHLDILGVNDPLKKEEIYFQFLTFKKVLYTNGFLSFFEIFLKSSWNGLSVAERIMSYENGMEQYLDLIQIGELLISHQSKTNCTPEALLRFLRTFEILNFDSDERMKKLKDPCNDSVQVLTIHSSKGLEFDIVFALGLISKTPAPDTFIPVKEMDLMTLVPIQDTASESYLKFIEELNAEKMRQLYVALTRAKYRLYVPVCFSAKKVQEFNAKSSCMELFLNKFGLENLKSDSFIHFLNSFEKDIKITYSKLNDASFSFNDMENEEEIILIKPQGLNLIFKPTFMHSFTGLARQGHLEKNKGLFPRDFGNKQKTVHTLPTGAKTGILLHAILESIPFEKYSLIDQADELNGFLEPYLAGTKFHEWKNVIAQIIFNLFKCSLKSIKFSEIDPAKIYREKEFIYPDNNRGGFMKGIIDFMFMHENKYYFIDWKSNWLGNTDEAYDESALKNAMKENDYFFQAEIYKQAIYKFLKIVDSRDFEDCFGGIFYVFLRGLESKKPNLGILHFN